MIKYFLVFLLLQSVTPVFAEIQPATVSQSTAFDSTAVVTDRFRQNGYDISRKILLEGLQKYPQCSTYVALYKKLALSGGILLGGGLVGSLLFYTTIVEDPVLKLTLFTGTMVVAGVGAYRLEKADLQFHKALLLYNAAVQGDVVDTGKPMFLEIRQCENDYYQDGIQLGSELGGILFEHPSSRGTIVLSRVSGYATMLFFSAGASSLAFAGIAALFGETEIAQILLLGSGISAGLVVGLRYYSNFSFKLAIKRYNENL
jgi:hypothetical protein